VRGIHLFVKSVLCSTHELTWLSTIFLKIYTPRLYLKSRRTVRKNTLGNDLPPEAKYVPNKRIGNKVHGSRL